MTQTVVGVFHSTEAAERAVADLITAGFAGETISLVTPTNHPEHIKIAGSGVEHTEDMAIGAVGGGLLGGILGALVGMAVVTLPGIGLVIAAGPVAIAAVGGALGGGVLGAFTWAGITGHEAQVYEEFVKRGGTLVMLQASGERAAQAAAILHRDGAADANELEAEWRHEGLL